VNGAPRPVIDVVLVSWNDEARIAAALDSVFALSEIRGDHTFANVVLSDNGSADPTRELVRERYGERVTIIENGANLGFGAACNRAFARTSAPYVFLLNPDAQLRDHALASVVAFMETHPRCGLAGSRIYNTDGTIAESCGEFDTWTGAFLRSSAWGELPVFRRFANGAALRAWGHRDERRVDLAIGAALCVRRELLETVGVFDERFFLYHEEVDLAKRAAAAGFETWYVPSSEAVHEGMGSATSRAAAEAHKQRSRRRYWIKHHGYLWYFTLCAALLARFSPLLAAALGSFLLVRGFLRRRRK
jgi:GT2 family glycosyltransferase